MPVEISRLAAVSCDCSGPHRPPVCHWYVGQRQIQAPGVVSYFEKDQGQRDGAGVCQPIRGPETNGKWRRRPVPVPRRPSPELWGQCGGQLLALVCGVRRGGGGRFLHKVAEV
jgi:hypothetical protein